MSKKLLIKAINRQTNISKLEALKATGLDMLISHYSQDITIDDKAELVDLINDRIVELGGTI